MGKTKYMMSAGLAFSEAGDMKKLRREALRGWHLKRFRCAGYELEKGESEDVIYSIDYRLLEPNEQDEYFGMFEIAGWTHVCTEYNMHIFKADRGTVPIYSDSESARDKIRRLAIPVRTVTLYVVGLMVLSGLLMKFTSGVIQSVSIFTFYVALIIAGPAVMTYAATFYHRWKKRMN
ncbi:DUF2812 domain-containing protein [Sporosarcina cascadiensis]|uniref:DUF2812 domain-containing protein n=1 Tax=Sporosarcina cascadiensis TaxID=2660747 RepID=UPI001E2A34F3|nr:DUF2812 domain-containing protein [Sporosarcina cascadiensis]